MKSWKTKNEYQIYQVLSGRSNAYLILKKNVIILVDTGKESAFDKLQQNVESLNIKISDISHLILTHTHFDHCQSVKKIKEKSDCQVIVSSKAAASKENGYTLLPKGTFLATKIIARLGQSIGKKKYGYEPFQSDILINGEHNFEITGDRIKIIETDGHSTDSISILVDEEVAIVGDAMFGVFKKSIFPPYSDDINEMIKSWRKLLATGCLAYLPGHGKEITRSLLQKEYDKYSKKHKPSHQ